MLQPREARAVRQPQLERPDPVVAIAVMLLCLTVAGLALGGFLAVYDWKTPAAMRPLFFSGLGVFLSAVVFLVAAAALRYLRQATR
jgi:hypothetical protein